MAEPSLATVREILQAAGVTSLMIDGERVLAQGHKHALVASKSVPGEWHSVEYDEEGGFWTCTCKGYQVRKRCRHARAIGRWDENETQASYIRDEEEE